ncbi:MAG: ABC transporter ATP-binding protein/permease [Anaerolineae bacterium]|nr:ABC transporter ATP-binding protein/permease [Anaerolineae bacterium]MDW8070142.1 ABC transporter ATP-binding protein [Anaerolineae bacterium]
MTNVSKSEFRVATAYTYNRSGPLRWIISHARRYPLFLPGLLIASIVNNLCYGYIQVLVGEAFDLITSADWTITVLGGLALSILAVALVQGAMALARNYSVEFLAQRIERDARDELYLSLLGKSQTFHSRQRVGDIMARATNDVRALNLMFSPGLMLIVDSAMAILMPLLLIGRIHVTLLLVPCIFLVMLGVTVWDYTRRLAPVSIALRDQFGILNAGLAEAIGGIEVVKANVRERYEWDKFTRNARRYRDLFVQQGEIQALYWPLLAFSIAWGAGFLHALLIWRDGVITLGQVVAFMGLMETFHFATYISLFSFNLVQMGIAAAKRILEMINTETELDENVGGVAQPIRGQVTFENVTFSYNGAPVLKNISFTVHPGETVAIVGQTGSGKTTLTKLINRTFDVQSGRVLIDGIDVRDWNLDALRSQISTIEQDVFLFSRSIAENIAFGCADATQEEIERAARDAQAHDFIMAFKDGYATQVGERGVTLSGGQRQRIAIARAFLTRPRILILDDSTSAIDSATEDQIQRAIRRISRQQTTFLITHRVSQIRWADRILVLRRGELVAQGTHEELLQRSPDYRRIFAQYVRERTPHPALLGESDKSG